MILRIKGWVQSCSISIEKRKKNKNKSVCLHISDGRTHILQKQYNLLLIFFLSMSLQLNGMYATTQLSVLSWISGRGYCVSTQIHCNWLVFAQCALSYSMQNALAFQFIQRRNIAQPKIVSICFVSSPVFYSQLTENCLEEGL